MGYSLIPFQRHNLERIKVAHQKEQRKVSLKTYTDRRISHMLGKYSSGTVTSVVAAVYS